MLAARVSDRVLVIVYAARDPLGLLDAWRGADGAILIDASRSGARPGTLHCFDAVAAPLPVALSPALNHSVGAAEAVELARELGRLPDSLLVYTIEGERFAEGPGLSPAVRLTVTVLVDELATALDGHGSGFANGPAASPPISGRGGTRFTRA